MPTVTNTVVDLSAQPLPSVLVEIELQTNSAPAFVIATEASVERRLTVRTSPAGVWSTVLLPNDAINPLGTVYKVTEHVGAEPITYYIEVPAGVGPYNSYDLLVPPLGPVGELSYIVNLVGGTLVKVANITARNALAPTAGDLVYVTDIDALYHYSGVQWEEIHINVGTTAPEAPDIYEGQLWYDSSAVQLKVRAGGVWHTVYPPIYNAATFGPNVKPHARVWRNSNQSIAHNTQTAISFTTEVYETGNMFQLGQPTRLTMTAAGYYRFGTAVGWSSAGAGTRMALIRMNGTTDLVRVVDEQGTTANTKEQILVSEYLFNLNDYIELFVYQFAGGGLDIVSVNPYSPVLWASWFAEV